MVDADACRAARRDQGRLGLAAFHGPAFVGVVWTAYQEGEAIVRQAVTLVGLVLAALALGLGIALVDARPGRDDTGISAVALFAACVLLGAVSPRHPWLWAVAVGLWIPVLTIVLRPESLNYAALLALVFARAGVRRRGDAEDAGESRQRRVGRCPDRRGGTRPLIEAQDRPPRRLKTRALPKPVGSPGTGAMLIIVLALTRVPEVANIGSAQTPPPRRADRRDRRTRYQGERRTGPRQHHA